MKKIISLLTTAAIIFSFSSCKKDLEDNSSSFIPKNTKSYNSITDSSDLKDTSLKDIGSFPAHYDFCQGCMFKDEFYTVGKYDHDQSKTFFSDYISGNGSPSKSNDINGSYEYIYNVYYHNGKYYTIEADKTNSYICRYDAVTMALEKTSVLFENNPDCEDRSIYKYQYSDYMYINNSDDKIKFDQELNIEHTDKNLYLTDNNNNSYAIDYNNETSAFKLSKYDADNNLIYESTDFEYLSSADSKGIFYAFIKDNILFISCCHEDPTDPVLYVSKVHADTGIIEQCYQIPDARRMGEGFAQYDLTYCSDISVLGFNASNQSSDKLFTLDNSNSYYPAIDDWQCENDELHIVTKNINTSFTYDLLKVNDSGNVVKALDLDTPEYYPLHPFLLCSDNENIYLSTTLSDKNHDITGISIDSSDNGQNFNAFADISFDDPVFDIQALYIDDQKNIYTLCMTKNDNPYIMYKYNSNGEKINEVGFDFFHFCSLKMYNDKLYIFHTDMKISQYSIVDTETLNIIEQTDLCDINFMFLNSNTNNCNCYYYDYNANAVFSISLENENLTKVFNSNDDSIYLIQGFFTFSNGTFIIQNMNKLYISCVSGNTDIKTTNTDLS